MPVSLPRLRRLLGGIARATPRRAVQRAAQTLGYRRLRPGQGEAVEAVLKGRDTLVVMPTGSGKSAIYQMAALLIPGPTVVVSPLIALQKDQVESLAQNGAVTAAEHNSAVTAAERRAALADFTAGDLELLFLAPEQFNDPDLLERLRAARPSLVVIDEAHCISSWGHDFRPEYLRIGAVAEALGDGRSRPRLLALTATAAPPVREEIVSRLGMREPSVLVRGFDRPNIRLEVVFASEEDTKQEALLERVAGAPRPGIVYAATRRRSEEVAAALRDRAVTATYYHAGMRSAEREAAQDAFMRGEVDVMVATTAFGMGIDKADVRFVYHHDAPDSIDSYYQEIGRAGRDGEPAEAVLFYRQQDLGLRRFFAGGGQIGVDELEKVAAFVGVHGGELDVADLERETDLSATKLATALHLLSDVGALRLLPSGTVKARRGAKDWHTAAERAAAAQQSRQEVDQSRVEMVRAYAEGRGCRREFLLTYFGEPFVGPCGNCDADQAAGVPARKGDARRRGRGAGGARGDRRAPHPFPVGARVRHQEWGGGQVLRHDGERITVLFDDAGYKTLGVALVIERGLLTAEPAGGKQRRGT
jgi:ATP-dependent DNA helicase RecQ